MMNMFFTKEVFNMLCEVTGFLQVFFITLRLNLTELIPKCKESFQYIKLKI